MAQPGSASPAEEAEQQPSASPAEEAEQQPSRGFLIQCGHFGLEDQAAAQVRASLRALGCPALHRAALPQKGVALLLVQEPGPCPVELYAKLVAAHDAPPPEVGGNIQLQLVPLQRLVRTGHELTQATRELAAAVGLEEGSSYSVSYSCRGDDKIQMSAGAPEPWLDKQQALAAVAAGIGPSRTVDLKSPGCLVCVRLWRRPSDRQFECGLGLVPGRLCRRTGSGFKLAGLPAREAPPRPAAKPKPKRQRTGPAGPLSLPAETDARMLGLLRRAIDSRAAVLEQLLAEGTDCYRLGPVLMLEQHEAAAQPLALASAVVEVYPAVPLFLKQRCHSSTSAQRAGQQIAGPAHGADTVTVCERELRFELRLCHEEHVGLWLDSRPARKLCAAVSKGRRVLNLFSHSAGFGLAAAAAGALSTENVDNKASCHRMGQANYAASGLGAAVDDRKTFHKADVVSMLDRVLSCHQRSEPGSVQQLYDLIVLDPPPCFSRHSKINFVAKQGYSALLARCLRATKPAAGSLVLAGLNARAVADAELERMIAEASAEAGVGCRVLKKLEAGADFAPGCPDRPTARFFLLECD